MAAYIEAFFALLLLIFSLSYLIRPRRWADFLVAMDRTGFSSLIIPMYTLPTGLFMVLGHNLWAWDWRVFVTIAGWGMTTKSVLYLLFLPRVPSRLIANVDRWQSSFGMFRLVGIVGAALGGFLTWKALGALPV